jgi:hypothetical protein
MMWSRAALVAIALAGCGFRHGELPDGRDGAVDGDGPIMPADAAGCAAVAVAAGGDHTCAVTVDGSLYCWGRGAEGQIGLDPLTYACASNTVYCQKVPGKLEVPPMIAVGLGAQHSCAATGTQTYCWGRNTNGQFGNGNLIGVTRPVMVVERDGATSIDAGNGHTCSLAGDEVVCSGANAEGQVGNMSIATQPTALTVMTGATSLDLDSTTSCAIDDAKHLYCWGRNAFRTIDPATTTIKTFPTKVDGIGGVEQVAVGGDHICALVGDHKVVCWGLNSKGQLGIGQVNDPSDPQPFTTAAVTGAVEVVAAKNHTCVRTDGNGTVYCFGEGYTPTPMPITTGAIALAAGSTHDCAIVSDGTVRCWGDQLYGQLGNGTDSATRTTTPQLAKLCP